MEFIVVAIVYVVILGLYLFLKKGKKE